VDDQLCSISRSQRTFKTLDEAVREGQEATNAPGKYKVAKKDDRAASEELNRFNFGLLHFATIFARGL
jgi:hypothetical protein